MSVALKHGMERSKASPDDRFAAVADLAPVGIFQTDADGNCLFVNRRWCQLAGLTPSQAAGRGWAAALHPDDRERVFDRWYTAARTGTEFQEEYRFQSPDGCIRWLQGSAVATRDAAGATTGYLGTVTDVTEHRRAEEASRESARLLSLVYDHVSDCIYLLRVDGDDRYTFVSVNRVFSAVSGFAPTQVIGQPMEAVVPTANHELVRSKYRAVIAGRQSVVYTETADLPAGRRHAEITLAPIMNAAGAVTHILGTIKDMTELKREGEALRESEERFRTLADNLPAGFIYQVAHAADDLRRFTYVSRGVEFLFGVSPSAVTADPATLYGRIIPADRDRVRATEDAAMRAHSPFDCHFRIDVPRDGLKWVHCRSVPRPQPDGSDLWDGVAIDVTAQKRAEERLQAVLGSIDDHLVCYDHEWRYTYVNDKAAEVLGRSAAELLGQCIWELFPDAVGNLYYQKLHEAATTGRPVRFEHYYPPFDQWFENHAYPTTDGMTVYSADVTEYRRAEQLLDRYRLLSQHTRDIVLFVRQDGHIAEANDAAVAAYGYDREQLLAMTVLVLRDSATIGQVSAQMSQADGTGAMFETRHRRRDGSTFPVEVSSRGADVGGERLLLSIVRDITERKRADEVVLRQAAVFEIQTDAIIVTDLDGRIIDWNPASERILGYNKAEVLGKTTAMFHRPDEAATLTGDALAAVERNGVWRGEINFVRKDGTQGVCESVVKPLADGSGRVVGAVRVNRDVTDRKRAEGALREADRRKDEFLAMLAHELRNPLAPVRNAVQILNLAGPKDPTLMKARATIERQVGHMARMLDDLLDISRITRGKIRLKLEPVDLTVVLRRAAEAAMPLVKARGHELTVTAPGTPVRLSADATRLEQVFVNLISNAAKYTPDGGTIRVTVDCRDGEVAVTVADTGIGISGELLPKVFDLFVQAEQGSDRSQGGLGIGLTLVKTLTELHGGAVSVASDGPGQGAAFTVRLPQVDCDPATPQSNGAALASSTKARRILVVDDNRDAAESLATILELTGHQTAVANDGPAAVATAAQFHPNVVFLDIGLPGMDGCAVARALRDLPGMADAVLVATTGYGQEDDVRRTKAAGIDHHLVKPVDPAVILALLQSMR
jgi:PAS domain S-box-containing protein